jgi:hypothetical protein
MLRDVSTPVQVVDVSPTISAAVGAGEAIGVGMATGVQPANHKLNNTIATTVCFM